MSRVSAELDADTIVSHFNQSYHPRRRNSSSTGTSSPGRSLASSGVQATPDDKIKSMRATLSPRSIFAGVIVGILISFANVYFGLQTGFITTMNLPSTLIGFSIFKVLGHRLEYPFMPAENAILVAVAGSLGTMPSTAGLVGVIPALEFLTTAEQNGPLRFTIWKLFVWSAGISIGGVVVAFPLRSYFLIRERLRFPWGTSTAVLIGLLHKDATIAQNVDSDDQKPNTRSTEPGEDEQSRSFPQDSIFRPMDDDVWRKNNLWLIISFIYSAIYTLCTYFAPAIRRIPIFGTYFAREWLVAISPSPAYISLGLIVKPITTMYMVVGAIIGWGILSPLAKLQGWAPGPTEDWETGSQGWIVWVALGLMLGDSFVGITWIIVKVIRANLGPSTLTARSLVSDLSHGTWADFPRRARLAIEKMTNWKGEETSEQEDSSRAQLLADREPEGLLVARHNPSTPSEASMSARVLALWTLTSAGLCFGAMWYLFGALMPTPAIIVAILLVVPLSLVTIRAYGETGQGGTESISKIAQFLFALLIPQTRPGAILVFLAVAGITEAGTWQSAELMDELKTGYLVNALPEAMFYAQLIGSFVGAFVASSIYRLYTTMYLVPGDLFPVPNAHMWISSAKLVAGSGLPEGVWSFAVGATALSAICSLVRIVFGHKTWSQLLPPATAVAVGMYVRLDFTLARALGTVIRMCCMRYWDLDELFLVSLSSGFMLGEGIFSIVNLLMTHMDIPHL